ncbi:class I SAM-dependent methyltransferase [Candidatus Poribacteria bacterium]|nr:class I SAM-dependent methyltransferase [Candidatus Poribacteria bacterium]
MKNMTDEMLENEASSLFDAYADEYDAALAQGLSVSGEDKNYFARGRIVWLADCLPQLQEQPKSVMDFGCGIGSTSPFLRDVIGSQFVLGVDISVKVLKVAKQTYGSEQTQFLLVSQYQPREQIDMVYSNGVFHHIPPPDRAATVNYIYRSLRPGGLFAFWENNPWNPATRLVMSRIPFDRNAIPVTTSEARNLLRDGGFEVLRTDFLFIFPRILRWLRWIEPLVSQLPLGAQYQILCRKPFPLPE